MLFYGREQGAESLDQIESLDLSFKSVLMMPSADVFSQMTSLKRIDLSGHPEFFYDEADEQIEKQKAVVGLPKEQREGVSFMDRQIKV